MEPDLDPAYTFAVLTEEAGRCLAPGRYVAALVAHAQRQERNCGPWPPPDCGWRKNGCEGSPWLTAACWTATRR
ncbi:hypothetical protein ACFQU7_42620 [Pseudoroseomonas wenyumeiae]